MNRICKTAALATSAGLAAFTLSAKVLRKVRRFSCDGKTVVITGGSRGLGLRLAEEFGVHGARLVLAARDAEELTRAKQILVQRRAVHSEQDVLAIPCDLTVAEEAERLIREATEHFGRVDVLINNTGVIHVGPVEEQTVELYRAAMNSNFFSMLYTTYAVLPQMLQRHEGAIANVASIGAKIPVPHLAPYTASKFAAAGFSETLHAELRQKGIRVTTINPGLMRTGSYPNAIVVGRKEDEYRWFRLAASLPGLAHSADYAARKIFCAIVEGRAEIEIGIDAYVAARLHGISPSMVQFLESLAAQAILPKPGGTAHPAKGTDIRAPEGLWRSWSDLLTRRFNQPPA